MAGAAGDAGRFAGIVSLMDWTSHYIGEPFNPGGGPPGFHCWSLVRAILKDRADIEVPSYGDISAKELLAVAREMNAGAGLTPFSTKIEPRAAQALDVVVMHGRPRRLDGTPGQRANIHVGIMVDSRNLIHVEDGVDVHRLALTHSAIRYRVVGLYRHEALTCSPQPRSRL